MAQLCAILDIIDSGLGSSRMRYFRIATVLLALGLVSATRASQECSVCFNAGKSTFPSIAACEARCRETGNRPALSTCGVRASCPSNRGK